MGMKMMMPLTPHEWVHHVEDLEQQIATHEKKVTQLESKITVLEATIERYQAQLRQARQARFSPSQERSDQIQLAFNEAEAIAPDALAPSEAETPDEVGDTVTYQRKKKRGQREANLAHLPVERIEYTLPEGTPCAVCHQPLHAMSTEVRRELQVVPARVTVVEHIQHLYSCRTCEHEAVQTPIRKAPMPRPLYPGSLASASLLAEVLHQKYTLSLPLYRQAQEWERQGIPLSRQTLANWVIYVDNTWLRPVYQQLQELLRDCPILHADETPVQVLQEAARRPDQQSYMWLYQTGAHTGMPPIVLYDYQTTRSGEHPRRFLAKFQGFLHVDGYPGYHGLPDVILVGCWAHARRKFQEALKSLPAAQRNGPHAVRKGLDYCNRLFAIERTVQEGTVDERYRIRQEQSRIVLAEFKSWLEQQHSLALPQSPFGKAVTYCLNQWGALTTFVQDGRLSLDNNRAERAIKPFVIGRKNWLFANTPRGARASAVVYSVIETAKANGLNPRAYLQYLFEQLPHRDLTNPHTWVDLLPTSSTLPDTLRSPGARTTL